MAVTPPLPPQPAVTSNAGITSADASALKSKLDRVLEKLESISVPSLDAVTGELRSLQGKVDKITDNAKPTSIWLKAAGVVSLALITGWWTSYLTGRSAWANKIHEKIAERSGDAYFEAGQLMDSIQTDLEAFCLDTRQDTKTADGHASKFRALVEAGPFPERVNDALRAFNNYVQETMALRTGKDLSSEEGRAIRGEARRLRAAAVEALRSWAG